MRELLSTHNHYFKNFKQKKCLTNIVECFANSRHTTIAYHKYFFTVIDQSLQYFPRMYAVSS